MPFLAFGAAKKGHFERTKDFICMSLKAYEHDHEICLA